MTEQPTVVISRSGGVLVLTLNRPERLNAATPEMFTELRETLADLGDARSVLINGAGRAFCAGADVSSPSESPSENAYRHLVEVYNPVMLALSALRVPVVSAVRGAVAGIGCSLALAADFCVASESAYFLHAFVNVGLVPDGGASWTLPRLVGRARALQMMMLGDRIPASKALEWGMIHDVVGDEALDTTAQALADRLARGPTEALGLIRAAVAYAADHDYPAAMALEAHNQRLARASRDADEGMLAFREKRKPEFGRA